MAALPSFFNNKLPILKQIPIFQGLNWFELNRISRYVEIVKFNKGDIICQQGAPADAFYALVSGRVYSYTLSHSGHKEDVDFILRGMQFGIISTLTGETIPIPMKRSMIPLSSRSIKTVFPNCLNQYLSWPWL